MFTEITDDTLDAHVASGLSMVLYYKDRCPFCKAMEKIIVKFSAMPDIKTRTIRYCRINRETNPKTVEKFAVTRTPTVIIFRDGRQLACKSGDVTYKELERMIG